MRLRDLLAEFIGAVAIIAAPFVLIILGHGLGFQ